MEVIITLTGPLEPVLVRRKKKILGVWVNADTVEVDAAPSFYAVAANKPLNQIVSNVEDIFKDISVNQLIRSVGAPQHIEDSPEFTKALIRIRESKGLYSTVPVPITVSDDTLFGAHFAMPANLVEGEYLARIFLVRNKTVVSEHSNKIDVRKVGLERWIYSEAHNHAFTYGLLCVLVAGLTGWACIGDIPTGRIDAAFSRSLPPAHPQPSSSPGLGDETITAMFPGLCSFRIIFMCACGMRSQGNTSDMQGSRRLSIMRRFAWLACLRFAKCDP